MKFGVNKKVLLYTAGCVWIFAGINILRIGIVTWLNDTHYWLFKIGEATIVFLLFFNLVFKRLFYKHSERISRKNGKHCPFSFFDVKGISYNFGHGDKQRVKDCFRIVLVTMFSFNLILMLFMILFPSTVASAFTSDERLIETVRWTMPVFLGGMTIFGLQRACQNMFVALGQARISIFIALLRKAILLIPLALILPNFMGVTGVYAAEAISDATAAICCTLLFFWQFPKILGKIKGNTLRVE